MKNASVPGDGSLETKIIEQREYMMANLKILTVSLFVALIAGAANAEVASKAYVQRVLPIVTDTYNAEGTDAVSGKAVAQAIASKLASTQETKDGILTTNAETGAVEVATTIASTKVSGLGTLATLDTVTTTEITDGTIVNADISDTAAISMTKIDGLSTALTAARNQIPSGSENNVAASANLWVE